jgi:alkylation response protein AidB-like acyl-CoA dehydrogenase
VIEAAGEAGQLTGSVTLGTGEADVLAAFYKARPSTIYGGSSEVQRNILAKSVLQLPS